MVDCRSTNFGTWRPLSRMARDKVQRAKHNATGFRPRSRPFLESRDAPPASGARTSTFPTPPGFRASARGGAPSINNVVRSNSYAAAGSAGQASRAESATRSSASWTDAASLPTWGRKCTSTVLR